MNIFLNYKHLLIFLSLAPFISYSQISTTSKRGYSIEFNESDLGHYVKIRESDSLVNSKRIRKETKKDTQQLNTAEYYFEYENDKIILEKIEVYNKDRLVFSVINYKGVPIEKYSYTYDTEGRIIKKSGFSSGDSGSTTYYSYQK